MAVSIFSTSEYFGKAMHDRYPGREHYLHIVVEAFPLRDLAPICYITSAASLIHPAHLLVPGRTQVMTVRPYMIIQPGSLTAPPIICHPQKGSVWVNRDILRVLGIYPQFVRACATNDEKDWATFWLASVNKQPIPDKYPALWTPLVAVRSAKPGAIVELIHFALDYRHYAVITDMIAMDSKFVLFMARLLGFTHQLFQCLVKVPFDLADIVTCFREDRLVVDIEPTVDAQVQWLEQQGNCVRLSEVVTSSAILENYLPPYVSILDEPSAMTNYEGSSAPAIDNAVAPPVLDMEAV